MTPPKTQASTNRPIPQHWVAASLGAFAFAGAVLTLVGWFGNFPQLTDWDGNGISMFANTAIAAVCSGLALMLLASGRRASVRILGTVVASIRADQIRCDLALFGHANDHPRKGPERPPGSRQARAGG